MTISLPWQQYDHDNTILLWCHGTEIVMLFGDGAWDHDNGASVLGAAAGLPMKMYKNLGALVGHWPLLTNLPEMITWLKLRHCHRKSRYIKEIYLLYSKNFLDILGEHIQGCQQKPSFITVHPILDAYIRPGSQQKNQRVVTSTMKSHAIRGFMGCLLGE